MNIECFLLVEGNFEVASLPEETLLDLVKAFRVYGTMLVHFEDRSVEAKGVYVPAVGSNTHLMTLPDIEY